MLNKKLPIMLSTLLCSCQFQQEEMESFKLTPKNWDSQWNITKSTLLTLAQTDFPPQIEVKKEEIDYSSQTIGIGLDKKLYYMPYEDGFAGKRYLITDSPHTRPDGSTLFPITDYSQVRLEKVRRYAICNNNETMLCFEIALVHFSAFKGNESLYGEYLYVYPTNIQQNILKKLQYSEYASKFSVNDMFNVQ